jgi:catechol 2,3-dioxygenase-like lactoylglutathione lyase family enzyme/nitroimidazol reductase NimA-like FMN-containing flavoprotein (pyridoxamine 5'-phosphate oxidase superfamily)
MENPQIRRPHFPPGYLDQPKSFVAWEDVVTGLVEARNYWLCSVRPNSRPHAVPKWAVWINNRIYFDGSPQTRHARNIAANPFVTLHLESGDKVVIVEGTAREVRPEPPLASAVAQAYTLKYAAVGYAPESTNWDAGGLFEITPLQVLAWNNFTEDPTKFIFTTIPEEKESAPKQKVSHIALVVREYDEAIDFFCHKLGFELLEDTYQPEQDKRWVVVAPPGSNGTSILLARASNPEQHAAVGNQTGGRVFLFLRTDDFWRDYERMLSVGVRFVRPPKQETYGTVSVFEDLYGNRWDLVGPNR